MKGLVSAAVAALVIGVNGAAVADEGTAERPWSVGASTYAYFVPDTDEWIPFDLELLAVRNRYDDSLLSRRLRVSVQSVRVIDEMEIAVLEPSHLLVAPVATGGGTILVAPGTEGLVATAREAGAAIWLVVPLGLALPARLLEAMDRAARNEIDEDELPYVEWTGPRFDTVIGPDGIGEPSVLNHRADCAAAPELLRLG